MKTHYDVIIIGAGPAGLKCAEQLRNSNLSVLLIERNKIIGQKKCAGGLTDLVNTSDIPLEITKVFSKYKVFSPNKQYEINCPGFLRTIDRFELGQYQLRKIENSKNILILKSTLAHSINGNKIKTNRGIFYFKYLVGADGSSSIVRKYLRLKSKISMGLYYNISQITNDLIFYVNPQLLRLGYIWVFPHKDYTNIGIYFYPEYLSSKKAKEILEHYLKDNGYQFSDSDFSVAPLSYCYEGCTFNNVFLVGDAAGLVIKTTGEGIHSALISGKEIGNKILNHDYKMVELERALMVKKFKEMLLKIIHKMPSIQKYPFMFPSGNRYFYNLSIIREYLSDTFTKKSSFL